jgi:hypothetical protein
MSVNPFFELYVGDRLSSREFVNIFSPFLVGHAEALFLPGNIVVKGVQGSGKSMLLSLLKPEVRMEYARAGAEFPVRKSISNFIGAGINLAHSNAIDFGYRAISTDPNETSLFFADFVNYTILLDLLHSIQVLVNPIGEGFVNLQIEISDAKQREFVRKLSVADVFQGALLGCHTLEDVETRIRTRLNSYRRFLHLNDKELSGQIKDSKTDIGSPISIAVQLLKQEQVIDKQVSIFIHIDQYEELANISSQEEHSPDYRRVINRALARRDPAISYRIGTRGHAWRNHGWIFGASAKLEEERDYKFVDLDLMLRRHENRRTWIFPGFVEDVFARRLEHAGLAPDKASGRQLLESFFGLGVEPSDKARAYGGSDRRRSVKVDGGWPIEFKEGLNQLADDDPLTARLFEAWALQTIDRGMGKRGAAKAPSLSMNLLPVMQTKTWWKKERIDLALIQIAGRCQERPFWCGYHELIDLSGGNILTFLSICQFIWDTQNQLGSAARPKEDLDRIDNVVQAIGVFKASDYWLKKISQETGRSGDRFRLARQIGKVLTKSLYADRQMSYPGHNGFSLADDELEKYPHVKELLEEMNDYGTLVAWRHTTKEKDRRSRQKFYLNPVLCPQFKMHYKRHKEPLYVHPAIVEDWLKESGLASQNSGRSHTPVVGPQSLPLFGDDEDS